MATYMVSGEYSMIKNAVLSGSLAPDAINEALIALFRAGSDLAITYFVLAFADLMAFCTMPLWS